MHSCCNYNITFQKLEIQTVKIRLVPACYTSVWSATIFLVLDCTTLILPFSKCEISILFKFAALLLWVIRFRVLVRVHLKLYISIRYCLVPSNHLLLSTQLQIEYYYWLYTQISNLTFHILKGIILLNKLYLVLLVLFLLIWGTLPESWLVVPPYWLVAW